MSYSTPRSFGRRIGRLERKHRKLSRGAVTVLRSDGLMVMRPRRRGLPRLIAFLFLAGVGLTLFKVLAFVAQGEAVYTAQVDELAAGTRPEAVAASILEIDPVTGFLIETAAPQIRKGLRELEAFRAIWDSNTWLD
ncbi:MAG: hypothetical protein AAFP13_06340 [Pseudomonadota bacterium]